MINRLFNTYILYPAAERWLGRDIRSKVKVLRKELAEPFEDRLKKQQIRLANVLATAAAHVPYYRDLFGEMCFDPENVRKDVSFLREIPYLTKDIIRREGERMLNEKIPKEALIERKTGASTGPSTVVYYSKEGLDWTAAVNLYCRYVAGRTSFRNEIHISTKFPEATTIRDRFKEWIKCATFNRTNLLTDRFDERGLELFWRQLKRVRPYLLHGHPSSVYVLAQYVIRRKYRGQGIIKVFESTGETLDRKKRETIEQAFQCRVINRFGNAEFGVVAYESPQDSGRFMRVLDNIVFPETMTCDEGPPEIVLTGLRNEAMPLIRYRTGDLGELAQDDSGWRLPEVVGRIHDVVRIGDATYPTHFIQDMLDRLGGIAEFQVAPQGEGRVVLRIVLEQDAPVDRIAGRIKEWWQSNVQVEFVDFNELVRQGRLGKFRYVVRQETS